MLFIAEAVTLAHVARPMALASNLNAHAREFDIAIACAPRYRELFPECGMQVHAIDSITSVEFLERLVKGRPVYDVATLRRYVADDLRVLDNVKPSVVVGDFRLSLAVSARLRAVPYVNIINAYWSPFARPQFELPSHSITRMLGARLASALFRLVRPAVFAYHTVPMNRIRREFELPSLGWDLRRIYTDGDYVAYADIPELIPTYDLPERHSYIGPVLWSPPVPLPPWWESLPKESPMIYVTMGSSGDASVLPRIVEALAPLPVSVVIASAGARLPKLLPRNVHYAQYVPGDLAAKRASLVVCNGGSPATHQALAEGVPVLGITTNMDQFLNMHYIAARGAGIRLRADHVTPEALRVQASQMLTEPTFRSAAAQLAGQMHKYASGKRLAAIVRQAVAREP